MLKILLILFQFARKCVINKQWLILSHFQIINKPNGTYLAAVPTFFVDAKYESVENKVVGILDYFKDKHLDIIVFPEVPINTSETAVEVVIGDGNTDPLIKRISDAVKIASAYTVINCRMKSDCPSPDQCPAGKDHMVYNSAIVFDRNGAVIAK